MAELSQQWLTALDSYAQAVKQQAEVGVQQSQVVLLDRVKGRARSAPGWEAMADNIELWNDDGDLIVGIRDQEMLGEAFALEYGDETRPPSPLFRTMGADVQAAGDAYTEHMINVGVVKRYVPIEEQLR